MDLHVSINSSFHFENIDLPSLSFCDKIAQEEFKYSELEKA